MSSILKVKDLTTGEWMGIPAIVGPKGESGVYVGSGEMPEGYNIQIDPSGDTPVFVSTTPQELTEEQRTQALENLRLNNMSTMGSNVFEIMETCPETVKEFAFELPVNWGRIKIANIHINFGKIETAFTLYGKIGGYTRALKDIGVGSSVGFNMFCVRGTSMNNPRFATGMTVHLISADSALPTLSSASNTNASANSKALAFYSSTDGVLLPEGTIIQVWGVYE